MHSKKAMVGSTSTFFYLDNKELNRRDHLLLFALRSRAKTLAKTLDSLKLMRKPAEVEWELVVVDNHSNDETKEGRPGFQKRSAIFSPLRLRTSPWPSRARNTGVLLALGEVESSGSEDIIAFTDDDVIVDRNWLSELVRAFERFDCVGFAGKIVPVWNCPKPFLVLRIPKTTLER